MTEIYLPAAKQSDLCYAGLKDVHVEFIAAMFRPKLYRGTVRMEKRMMKNAMYMPIYKLGRWDGQSVHVDFDSAEDADLFKAFFGSKLVTRSIEQVRSKAEQMFRKPGLLARVTALQERFTQPDQDGNVLLKEMQASIIEQGEWDFEQKLATWPIAVTLDKRKFNSKYRLNSAGEPSPLFKEVEDWLKKNVPADEYWAFPGDAIGKYKDCCFNVYFKTVAWATYFKVGYVF